MAFSRLIRRRQEYLGVVAHCSDYQLRVLSSTDSLPGEETDGSTRQRRNNHAMRGITLFPPLTLSAHQTAMLERVFGFKSGKISQ